MTGSGEKLKRGISVDAIRDYTIRDILGRLVAYMHPYRRIVIAAILLSFASSFLLVIRPYLVRIVIDRFFAQGNLDGFNVFMGIFAAVYVSRLVVGYGLGYLTGMIGQRVMHDLRMDIFNHVLSMDMTFFDHNRVGRLMTRITDDVSTLNELYTSGAIRIFNNTTILLGIVAVMFYMDWRLALVSLSLVPLMYLTGVLFANRVRAVYRNIRAGTARLNAFLQESIQGMRIIQIMRRTAWSMRKFRGYSDNLQEHKVRNVLYYGLFFPIMELIGIIGIILIFLAGGYRVKDMALDIGVLVAFIRLVDMMFMPVRELAENFNVMLAAVSSSERIFTLLDTESRITEPLEPEPLNPPVDIVFDHVWFAYEENEWVLRDVSFTVKPGEKVAFVGPSGSGKTTIISLLLRFYEVDRGRILIGGRDIRDIPIEGLRSLISHVGQEPFLFNRSVSDNIHLGNDTVSGDRIHEVLSRMSVNDMFTELENGLETGVREGGSRLSQGQRQLVSFSRALAADRDILVLDEATSSVDTFTENLIQQAVPVLMENRTSIVIAHRLSTVRNVDRIYVIARGRIRETGSHRELMELDGIYARLSRMHNIEG